VLGNVKSADRFYGGNGLPKYSEGTGILFGGRGGTKERKKGEKELDGVSLRTKMMRRSTLH